MEEFKKWLQEYVNENPGRNFLIKDNGEPNFKEFVDTSSVDVNKLDFLALWHMVTNLFYYEDYFE